MKNRITTHPGDVLKEELEARGISQKKFSEVLSVPYTQLNEILKKAVRKLTGIVPIVVGPGVRTGLDIKIDNPATLGSDIVVGCVAAIAKYPKPLIVIDMGTATTIVVVDKNSVYRGGVIIPGVAVAMESLTKNAAQLQSISLDAPKKAIGTNTADCMRSGLVFGNAAMIDGMIDRMSEEIEGTPTVIATGGLSKHIIPYCRHKII